MRSTALVFALLLAACSSPAKKPGDPHDVPVGKSTGTPLPAQATCDASRGDLLEPDVVEGARIADVCISGVSPERIAGAKKHMRLGPEKKLTADLLQSDLRAIYESGFFDQAEATARAAGGGSVFLFIKLSERPTITHVSLKGLKGLKDESVLAELPKRGAPLDRAALRRATDKLRQAYASAGWDEAKVEPVVVRDQDGGARLEIVVTEGTRAKLGKVTFDGAKGGREVGLRKAIELEEGAPVSEEQLMRAALLVNAFYYDNGFLNVRVEDPKRTRATDGTTAVTFAITEGPIFKIGSIKVSNVDQATEKDVLASLKVKPGEVFNRQKVMADLASAKAMLGLRGRAVTIEPETELDPKTGTVKITLAVRDGS